MEMNSIPFNKPYLAGNESAYILQAVQSGKISGDGLFTAKCHDYFETQQGFKKCLLTTSCTDALELAALILKIEPGDEVIMPSYTFVSTANAFLLRGANIVFCDSNADNPNMDADLIESLITSKTRGIVPVHYAGIACDMDKIMSLAKEYNLWVVEDAAQAFDGFYKGRRLGSIGHLAAFSFHETKNIQAGEGGMLVINNENLIASAEIIREKGTNRSAFFRGEVAKYNWIDIGSSFLPSDIIAAFLFAQLEKSIEIQKTRVALWERYFQELKPLADKGFIKLPIIPSHTKSNGHIFYIICRSLEQRHDLIDFMKVNNILSVFHYLSLHSSPFFKKNTGDKELVWSDYYSDTLLRLPLYVALSETEQNKVIRMIYLFFENRTK